MTRKAPCSYSCQRRHREATNRYSLEDNTSLGVVSSSITPALLWDVWELPGVTTCRPVVSLSTSCRICCNSVQVHLGVCLQSYDHCVHLALRVGCLGAMMRSLHKWGLPMVQVQAAPLLCSEGSWGAAWGLPGTWTWEGAERWGMLVLGSASPLGRLASTPCAGNEVKSLQGAGCQPQSNQLHSLPRKKHISCPITRKFGLKRPYLCGKNP